MASRSEFAIAVLAAGALSILGSLESVAHENHQHGEKAAAPAVNRALAPAEQKSLQKAVQSFIRQESEDNDGVFVVHDDKLDKDWNLKLLRLHVDKAGKLSEKLYSVCGDFKEAGGKAALDVDFLVNKTGSGWSVRQAVVHAVNGQARSARAPAAMSLQRPESAVAYTCSMHPEVVSDKPGQCPKCGMTLQKK